MQNLIGQSIGRYHILEKLGEGGMAVVYKAFDTHLEHEVAVKVIRTEQISPAALERALKRFEREAKAVAKLDHPNIVKVMDYGEHEGSPYLVMPYLPGGTLKQYLKERGRMAWKDAARLLIPIAEALDYAHEQKLIHRDVKPSNILLTAKGRPMLTDFGVAKIIDDEVTQDLTGTSATVGTPEYMAPEQVVSKMVDHRADIYALGVVFFEMVTGRRPFEADTPMAVLFKHASAPLPRPKDLVPDLPDEVEQVLLKALAKGPEDRYQDMGTFAAALAKRPDDRYQNVNELSIALSGLENTHPGQRNTDTPAIISKNEIVSATDTNQDHVISQVRINSEIPSINPNLGVNDDDSPREDRLFSSKVSPRNTIRKRILLIGIIGIIGLIFMLFQFLSADEQASPTGELTRSSVALTTANLTKTISSTVVPLDFSTSENNSYLNKINFLPSNAIYLGDLPPFYIQEGAFDYSIGEYSFSSPSDNVQLGTPISYQSIPFKNGIFAHAPSKIQFSLNGKYSQIHTYLFIDSKCGDGVIFEIIADSEVIYTSTLVKPQDVPLEIEIALENANTLSLVTSPGLKTNADCDWAIWGNPYLIETTTPNPQDSN